MLFRTVLVILLICVGAVAPVRAAVVGDAEVPYSATRIVTVDGKTYVGKVFAEPGRQRHDVEIHGIALSFILDLADHDGALLVPAMASYVDFPLPPLLAELDRHRLERFAVGKERILGMRAIKYHIDYTASNGSRGAGDIWISRDNILLRMEGRILRPRHRPMIVSMRLADLRFGPQSDKLFIIPKGLHKLPYQALQVLLNLRVKPRGQ